MVKLNGNIGNIAFDIRLKIAKRKLKKRINKSWDVREKAAIYLEESTDRLERSEELLLNYDELDETDNILELDRILHDGKEQ